ncbi:MAG: 6-phosphogluconolactonase [Vicinamibacterales bacterium]
MNVERHVLVTEADAALAAATAFANVSDRAIASTGRCRVALSGGRTPAILYDALADQFADRSIWGAMQVFWGDERMVPPTHEDSNYRMAHAHLLSRVPVEPTAVHPVPIHPGSVDASATAYERTIRSMLMAAEPPVFDLVLLGLGADGHTASLFPHDRALEERQRLVVGVRHADTSVDRVTVTLPLLHAASCVLFFVTGAAKASAVKAVLAGPDLDRRLPAQMVCRSARQVLWFMDHAAARELSTESPRPGQD